MPDDDGNYWTGYCDYNGSDGGNIGGADIGALTGGRLYIGTVQVA